MRRYYHRAARGARAKAEHRRGNSRDCSPEIVAESYVNIGAAAKCDPIGSWDHPGAARRSSCAPSASLEKTPSLRKNVLTRTLDLAIIAVVKSRNLFHLRDAMKRVGLVCGQV